MSEPRLISPMLDSFMIGDPISEHHGVRSCPAMDQVTENKYIVKIISNPSTPQKLEALLLSGAFSSKDEALSYFKEITDGVVEEIAILEKLSALEGFIPYEKHQIVPMEDGNGFDVYLLGSYKRTLARSLQKEAFTHLKALNLGLDLCAALSVCRRSGYLYVDLKPENVYCVSDNGFRIGDIGFIKLNSLKYASIPERYLSAYTAPEITDAYSQLNPTIDIYAVGLLLYQIFNGGVLPDTSASAEIPAPDYADYEMAEIILKACAANPEDRWQDPVEMGQALVSYMQRNGAHDSPIIPVTAVEEAVTVAEPAAEETTSAEPAPTDAADAKTATDTDEIIDSVEQAIIDEENNADDPAPVADSDRTCAPVEEDFENLSFLDNENDETLPGADPSDEEYDQISVEVSDMLTQLDELIAHPTPEPVVAPDPVEVQLPPEEDAEEDSNKPADNDVNGEIGEIVSAVQEEAANQDTDCDDNSGNDTDEISNDDEIEDAVDCEEAELYDDVDDNDVAEKTKKHWLRYVILTLLILGLLAGGYFFYKHYYVLHVDSITLSGNETELVVHVSTEIDESLLVVVCSDTYGNQRKAPVIDGKASFEDLAPDSAYTVRLEVNKGFHKLTGDISKAYTTPVQTNVANFSAVTGQTDGSVILRFTAEGPEAAQWRVTYTADGEDSKEATFTGNVVEITGLTCGKEYTFTLSPVEDLFYTGNTEITHTASKLVYAEELIIQDRSNGKLVVAWAAPVGTSVENWTVRCYNDKGFDETIVTNKTNATFENVDDNTNYNVEVAAAGMSVTQRTLIAANAVSVKDFKLTQDKGELPVLTWTYNGTEKQNWRISCIADGVSVQEITVKEECSVEIAPLIPGAKYKFNLQTSDGTTAVGGVLFYTVPEAKDFNDYNIKKSDIELKMCRTPSKKNWDRYDVADSDFTTEFSAGDKASFLLHLDKKQQYSNATVTTIIVIRDTSGQIISSTYTTAKWKNMWSNRYGEFNIAALPGAAGEYTLSVYFDGALAATQNFTIKN